MENIGLNFNGYRYYLVILMLLLMNACQRIPEKVNKVLAVAGSNRSELMNVIEHYKNDPDPKKLKATYFLIENMPSQSHFEGPGVDHYKKLFSKLLLVEEARKKDYETIWDSLKVGFGGNFPGLVRQVDDLHILKANYLINHIDAAFKAWKQPWARQLSFEDFCAYLLPYKLIDEEPTAWNIKAEQKYNWLGKAMKGSTDRYQACLLINQYLKNHFTIRYFPYIWDVSYNELDAIQSGKCFQATQYTAYVMRAMGIPVVMDYTPFWGNMNGGHEWNALIYHHKPIPFIGSESDPGKTKIDLAFIRKRAKVFRHTYALQSNALAILAGEDEDIPLGLDNNRIADVTAEYIPVSDLTVKLDSNLYDAHLAYISVFNRQTWKPVFWGVVSSSAEVTFKNMGREIVYLPMYYNLGEFIPASSPVKVDHNGNTTLLTINEKKKITLTVDKKGPQGPGITKDQTYELFYWKNKWVSAGKLKASKNSVTCINVPSNTLYWIHSSAKSTSERIFTYTNNKITWW